MKIKQRRPSYFSGFEDEENEVTSLEDFKNIEWLDNFAKGDKFYGYFYSKASFSGNPDVLMALYNHDPKYGGCKSWWGIGYIFGDGAELGLREYENFIGDHLVGCPQKTWQHNECTCDFRAK